MSQATTTYHVVIWHPYWHTEPASDEQAAHTRARTISEQPDYLTEVYAFGPTTISESPVRQSLGQYRNGRLTYLGV